MTLVLVVIVLLLRSVHCFRFYKARTSSTVQPIFIHGRRPSAQSLVHHTELRVSSSPSRDVRLLDELESLVDGWRETDSERDASKTRSAVVINAQRGSRSSSAASLLSPSPSPSLPLSSSPAGDRLLAAVETVKKRLIAARERGVSLSLSDLQRYAVLFAEALRERKITAVESVRMLKRVADNARFKQRDFQAQAVKTVELRRWLALLIERVSEEALLLRNALVVDTETRAASEREKESFAEDVSKMLQALFQLGFSLSKLNLNYVSVSAESERVSIPLAAALPAQRVYNRETVRSRISPVFTKQQISPSQAALLSLVADTVSECETRRAVDVFSAAAALQVNWFHFLPAQKERLLQRVHALLLAKDDNTEQFPSTDNSFLSYSLTALEFARVLRAMGEMAMLANDDVQRLIWARIASIESASSRETECAELVKPLGAVGVRFTNISPQHRSLLERILQRSLSAKNLSQMLVLLSELRWPWSQLSVNTQNTIAAVAFEAVSTLRKEMRLSPSLWRLSHAGLPPRQAISLLIVRLGQLQDVQWTRDIARAVPLKAALFLAILSMDESNAYNRDEDGADVDLSAADILQRLRDRERAIIVQGEEDSDAERQREEDEINTYSMQESENEERESSAQGDVLDELRLLENMNFGVSREEHDFLGLNEQALSGSQEPLPVGVEERTDDEVVAQFERVKGAKLTDMMRALPSDLRLESLSSAERDAREGMKKKDAQRLRANVWKRMDTTLTESGKHIVSSERDVRTLPGILNTLRRWQVRLRSLPAFVQESVVRMLSEEVERMDLQAFSLAVSALADLHVKAYQLPLALRQRIARQMEVLVRQQSLFVYSFVSASTPISIKNEIAAYFSELGPSFMLWRLVGSAAQGLAKMDFSLGDDWSRDFGDTLALLVSDFACRAKVSTEVNVDAIGDGKATSAERDGRESRSVLSRNLVFCPYVELTQLLLALSKLCSSSATVTAENTETSQTRTQELMASRLLPLWNERARRELPLVGSAEDWELVRALCAREVSEPRFLLLITLETLSRLRANVRAVNKLKQRVLSLFAHMLDQLSNHDVLFSLYHMRNSGVFWNDFSLSIQSRLLQRAEQSFRESSLASQRVNVVFVMARFVLSEHAQEVRGLTTWLRQRVLSLRSSSLRGRDALRALLAMWMTRAPVNIMSVNHGSSVSSEWVQTVCALSQSVLSSAQSQNVAHLCFLLRRWILREPLLFAESAQVLLRQLRTAVSELRRENRVHESLTPILREVEDQLQAISAVTTAFN